MMYFSKEELEYIRRLIKNTFHYDHDDDEATIIDNIYEKVKHQLEDME